LGDLRRRGSADPLPTDTRAGIRRLLRRCLERDRKRRLPDIADARIEIDEALVTIETLDAIVSLD
jgi:hypothetical protein